MDEVKKLADEVIESSPPLTLEDVLPEWILRHIPTPKIRAWLGMRGESTIPSIPAYRKSRVGVGWSDVPTILGRYWEPLDLGMDGQKDAIHALVRDPNKGYAFTGPSGVGKTHLLASQFKRNVRRESTLYTHDWLDSDNLWAQRLNAYLYNDGEPVVSEGIIWADAMDGVRHHVYIADFGVRRMTEAFRDDMSGMLDALFHHNGRLSIATQLGEKQILAKYNDRLTGRILGMCEFLEVK